MQRSRILGLGTAVPDRVIANDDLTQWMDTSHEWIVERTGIEERRWIEPGRLGSDMAADACRRAMTEAGVEPGEIDLLVNATLSPDYEFPGNGPLIQRSLGIPPVAVLDIRQQCSGFIYGMSIADNFIRTGAARTALVVGSEVQSRGMNLSTDGRHISSLFGDGAGAAVVGVAEDDSRCILSTHLHADGTDAEILCLPHPGWTTFPRITPEDLEGGKHHAVMEGRKVFKHAVTRMPEIIREALDANDMTLDDLDMLIPHQANLRINEALVKVLDLPPDKIHNNIQKYGNTTAATIPICMKEAVDLGKIQAGDVVMLAAFGAGLTWGAVLLRY